MKNYLGQITLVIHDYDEAIDYYTKILGFQLIEDTALTPAKRWVVIQPGNSNGQGCNLLLAKASNESQMASVGNQTGGRVFLFLYTSDLEQFYSKLVTHSVEIIKGPRDESYGKVLVFKDLYGNLWDVIQRN